MNLDNPKNKQRSGDLSEKRWASEGKLWELRDRALEEVKENGEVAIEDRKNSAEEQGFDRETVTPALVYDSALARTERQLQSEPKENFVPRDLLAIGVTRGTANEIVKVLTKSRNHPALN